jgi:NMD protein affecting ribosome stability and mRNA decay
MKYHSNRGKTCIVSGCNNKARVKGLCNMCYLARRKKEKYGKNL